ncbi:MAG: carboxypeptidase regulatory-like domain-containing protein [Thermoplasmatota archaeon]
MKGPLKRKYAWLPAIFLGMVLLGGIIPSTADAELTGVIRGYVSDNETQGPIADALVFLNNSDRMWRTDDKGYFVMDGIPYGDYEITVHKEGYDTSYKNITLDRDTNGTTYRFIMVNEIEISIGVITGEVYLEAEFDTVSGLYTADDAIVGFESGAGVPTGTIIDVTESASDTLVGRYTTIVSPGTHNLFCWAYSHHEEHSGVLTVSAGEVVRHDFHLRAVDMQNSGLAGNITDSDTGEPVPGASVMAYNTETGETMTTVADDNGFYFFTGPQPGDYTVAALAPGYDPDSGTGTVVWDLATYVDIQLIPKPLNTTALWGFVFGDGIPRSFATVFTDYHLTMTSNLFGVPGLYMICGFPGDEEHGVGAHIIGYYPQLHYITVPTGTVMRHDFYLQSMDQNFTRYAIVVASVWEDTTPRNPLPNSDVRLWESTYDQTLSTGPVHNNVMFTIVPAGPGYRVKGDNGGYLYERYVYNPGGVHHLPTDTFTVDVFAINYIDIYMNETQPVNKTEIWGFVYVNSFSVPVSGATVMELVPTPGVFDTTDPSGYYQQFVAPDTYALQALFPGAYSVQYLDHGTGSSGPAPWSGTVAPGESRHVDFIMKSENQEFSVIAGQVLDHSTHTPIPGYEVKAYNPGQYFPVTNADSFGFFMFSPIMDFSDDWTVNGHSPVHTVSLVEYDFLSSWTPMTEPDLPVTFTHIPTNVMWLNIYVNKTETPTEKTKLWGKVFLNDFGGAEVSGVPVMEHLVMPGLFDVTDSSGVYGRTVASGANYELDISYPTAYSIRYFDHVTGATGVAPWSGPVTGLSYRVDFAFKQRTKEYAEIMGQVTLESDGAPVSGFVLDAENTGGATRPPQTTDSYGLFEFNPVIDLSSDWSVDGSMPGYAVVDVQYHLIGSGASPSTSPSLPVDFPLSASQIMWLDIKVDQSDIRMGKAFGKVYLLPDNDPAVGADVKIIRVGESSPTETQVVGDDGLYRFDVPADDYTIKVTLSGYLPQSEVVTVPAGDSVYQPFYLSPSDRVSREYPEPVEIKLVNSATGKPLSDMPVVILGLGKNRTGDDGSAGFDLMTAGFYTVSTEGKIVSVTNETGEKDDVSDGKVQLEPGKEYTLHVRLSETVGTSERGEEGSDVSTGALIGAIIAALVIGAIAGYLIRRPGQPENIEE